MKLNVHESAKRKTICICRAMNKCVYHGISDVWSCLPAYTSSWPVSPAPKPSIGPWTGNWSQGPCTGSVEHISSGSCSLGNLCTKRISQICLYILHQYIMVHHSKTLNAVTYINENWWNIVHVQMYKKRKNALSYRTIPDLLIFYKATIKINTILVSLYVSLVHFDTNVQCLSVFYLPIDLTSTACRILRMPT